MKKIFDYPPLLLVVFLIAGILAGERFSLYFNDVFWVLFACAAMVLVAIILKSIFPISRYIEIVFFGVITVVIGSVSYVITDVRSSNDYVGNLVSKTGAVTLSLELQETLKSNSTFNRYVAEIRQVQNETSKGNVIVNVRKDSIIQLEIGSRFITKAPLIEISGPKNPDEFNYAKFLKNQQIYYQLYVDRQELLLLENSSDTFLVKLEEFREKLIMKIAANGITSNELGVMSALLLGERDYLSTELRTSYIDAGAIHILAISGLHIGILFLLFSFLLKPLHFLPKGKIIAQILIIAILWLFAVLAGLSASVVRAVTMFSFISIGLFLNRSNSVYHSLIASAFVLLLVHPRFLFDVGFQLSYTAVFFIVWLQPKLEKLWKPRFKILHYFWQLITVSSAAQLGVLPLSLFYFHQFPALFFVSNLVIIPVLGILLGVGILVLILIEFQFKVDFIIESYVTVIRFLNEFIAFVASYESFVIKHIFWSVGLLVTAYLVLLTFFKYVERSSLLRFGLSAFAIFSFYAVLFYESNIQKSQSELVFFHRSRSTVIGQLNGQNLKVYGSEEANAPAFMNTYISSNGIKEVIYQSDLPNLVVANSQKIVLIDSLGLYAYTSIKQPIVLLQNSPKINVERMIQKLNPSLIIADGSNFRSYVRKWEESSLKAKTPFHDTSQKGAFRLN